MYIAFARGFFARQDSHHQIAAKGVGIYEDSAKVAGGRGSQIRIWCILLGPRTASEAHGRTTGSNKKGMLSGPKVFEIIACR